jgi:N-acetylneuraminate synthase
MKIRLSDKCEVYDFCEPYIIAEIGANHNGDMALAEKLILKAREAGAHCVKFQSWTKDTVFSKKVYESNYFLADDYRNRTDYTLEEIVDEYSVSEEELLELKRISDDVGIDFASTPFSKREVDFLVHRLKVGFIKVASMDLNNYPFLRYISNKGLPIVLSTGLSSLSEIDRAVRTIEDAGNREIVLLHCVSIYPPDDHKVNLRNIETLRTMYPYPVGFSDHTLGFSVPLASAAMGACVIEKHFTLDKGMTGWDHKISADVDELRVIAGESKKINRALGSHRITVQEDAARIDAFRRSIVAARDISAGETFEEEMLDFKRPGEGLSPETIEFILGKKALRDIAYDEMIRKEDF